MPSSRAGWCLIFVVTVVVIAGVIGIGSAQETPATAVNTTTTPTTEDTQTANGTSTVSATAKATVSGSAASTTSTRPQTTPDANDGWQNATPIDANRTVNGTLPAGDQDWLVFTLNSGGNITVRLAAANRTDLSGFLYNHEGDRLDSSYVAPGEQISLSGEATTGGEYYVFIRNEASSLGAYAFNTSVTGTEALASEETSLQTEMNSSGGSGFSFALDLLAGIVVVVAGGYLLIHGVDDSSQVEDE